MFERAYKAVTVVLGVLAFGGSWAFAASRFGLLLGLGLGWLPALFVGTVVAATWPLLLLAGGVTLLFR